MNLQEARKEFEKSPTACKAVKVVRDCGVCHSKYCHYTTVDSLLKMLESRYMLLRRSDSLKFDDLIEGKKYGADRAKKYFFLSSFSYTPSENAAMWGLYCPATYRAIRVEIPQGPMEDWANSLGHHRKGVARRVVEGKGGKSPRIGNEAKIRIGGVSDVVYASVEIEGDENNRSRTLAWNTAHTGRIKDLVKSKQCKGVTGLLKDYEWRFESESRLYVSTKEPYRVDQIAVKIPQSVIEAMSFTFSPWADDEERELVEKRIKSMLSSTKNTFRKSVLTGALANLASRRGV